jgi:hypothetical protein
MGIKMNAYRIFVGEPEETTSKYLDIGERTILKWISERLG